MTVLAAVLAAVSAFVWLAMPLVGGVPSAAAQEPLSPAVAVPSAPSAPELTPEQADGRDPQGRVVRTSPALDGVAVYSVAFEGLSRQLSGTLTELAEHHAAAEAARNAIETASERRVALEELSGRAQQRRGKLTAERERFDAARRRIAVKAYTTDRLGEILSAVAESPQEGLRRAHDEQLLAEAIRIVHDGAEIVAERTAAVERDLETWGSQLREANAELATNEQRLAEALASAERLAARAESLREGMEQERPMTLVNNSDLPFNALDAYWRATNALAITQPTCRLPWWLLAGVGRSESNHARFGSAQMTADGRLTAPVIGIPLDGTKNTRAIVDSDGGLLDGDVFWDRAVGPMQFIPGTWRRWGADGNGDKVVDPQNMYDAALAAGRLLCSGGPVDTIAAMRSAVLRYNNSESYVNLVMARAIDYSLLGVPAGLIGEPTDPSVLAARGVAPIPPPD
ncbi:MAG: hypothetical protein GX868_17570 [Actinobacteria bacterium]|nr:hypothetical protein [Actinomycetota bacterium]